MDKVERVARALCPVDGRDTERQVGTGRTELTLRGSDPIMPPLWKSHEKEAARFAAAAEALGTIMSGG